ncbi:HAD family hydrolase [Marinobacter sp. NFXS9]|uniref:HAD family hydrolase n=1 Tax=Marinobacter sp. NFXS9 TaxID=2818433 RepID=UPI0032DF04EC
MLAIFDLDETLIAGDSSHLFAEYLVREGFATEETLLEPNRGFMAAYHRGDLDLDAYMQCNLAPVCGWSRERFDAVVADFIEREIRPRILATGVERVAWHRGRGDRLLVISATGDHLVKPIARVLGIEDALGVEVLWEADRLTGAIGRLRPFQQGKIDALERWLAGEAMAPIWFYSDSHNDLPLLNRADVPVAVNPDARLSRHAVNAGWAVLRDEVATA